MISRRSFSGRADTACAALAVGGCVLPSSGASVVAVDNTASVFSRSKEITCCGLLSSSTVKSSRLRSRTGLPFLSRTVTFTSTSSVVERKV